MWTHWHILSKMYTNTSLTTLCSHFPLPWLNLPTGSHDHVICIGNLGRVFPFGNTPEGHTEAHNTSIFSIKNDDHEWFRMTNAFILCDLLWKVQKSHEANREGSFKKVMGLANNIDLMFKDRCMWIKANTIITCVRINRWKWCTYTSKVLITNTIVTSWFFYLSFFSSLASYYNPGIYIFMFLWSFHIFCHFPIRHFLIHVICTS